MSSYHKVLFVCYIADAVNNCHMTASSKCFPFACSSADCFVQIYLPSSTDIVDDPISTGSLICEAALVFLHGIQID